MVGGETRELITGCLAGDDAAKAKFVAQYQQLLMRAIANKLHEANASPPLRADVEDIANNVLMRLLEGNCKPLAAVRDATRLEPWLVAVARNATVDYVRKWGGTGRIHEYVVQEDRPAFGPSPETEAMAEEERQACRELVNALAPRDKVLLDLYYLHGASYGEIAGILGISVNAVSVGLHRAKQRLRALVEREESRVRTL